MPSQHSKGRASRPVSRATTPTGTKARIPETSTLSPQGPSVKSAKSYEETPPKAPGAAVRREPISVSKRQARLARQAELKRRQQMITGVIAAVVVVLAAFLVYANFPHPGPGAPAPKACAVAPKDLPSAAATAPAVTGNTVTLKDGLKYIDIKVGCGGEVAQGAYVTMNYTGWLLNGKQFDSSMQTGRTPLQVNLGSTQDPNGVYGSVIPGWDEGIPGMQVGGVRRLIIPSALAYGAKGSQDGTIPPNTTLVFDVSVVSIP